MRFRVEDANRTVLAAALLLGACYASAPINGEGTSGSRLRRIVIRPESGEAVFAGWHDRELDVDCVFANAADGRLRCLPFGSLRGPYFLDADCSEEPVVPARAPCAEAEFVYELRAPAACGAELARTEVFAVDDAEISVDLVYQRRGDTCVAVDSPPMGVRRATRVDPTRFVAAEVIAGAGSGPLVRDRLLAEDGATRAWSLRDVARDVTCSFPVTADLERIPCMPRGSLQVRTGGARCEERWAIEGTPGCSPPELAVGVERDECAEPIDVAVYTVEELVPASERLYGEGCGAPLVMDDAYRTRRADEAAIWLTREWRGAGRLKIATWVDDEVRVRRRWGFYFDTELEFPCSLMMTTEGIRCVPGSPLPNLFRTITVEEHFADADCAEAAVEWSSGCVPPFAFGLEPAEACPSTSRLSAVYRVGSLIDAVYRVDPASGACVIDEAAEGGYTLEPIPLESLAGAERVVE